MPRPRHSVPGAGHIFRKVYFMSVSLYFGLPGCGKTTTLTEIAYNAINKKKSPYRHVYGNVHLALPGYTYIDNFCIGNFLLEDCLILIDEATLYADSRDFKNFSGNRLNYFMTHRHYRADIILFVQKWDAVDIKIRTITDNVYYVYKPLLIGHWFSYIYRIPYGIDFVSQKHDGRRYGDIIQGYGKPSFMTKLFAHKLYRPKFYKYFDSWEIKLLPPLPDKYKPYPASN